LGSSSSFYRVVSQLGKKLSLGLKCQVIGPTQRLGKDLVESVLTYTSGLKFSSPKKEYSVTIFSKYREKIKRSYFGSILLDVYFGCLKCEKEVRIMVKEMEVYGFNNIRH
jgi:hypothetical protein